MLDKIHKRLEEAQVIQKNNCEIINMGHISEWDFRIAQLENFILEHPEFQL